MIIIDQEVKVIYVLTFEDVVALFDERNIKLDEITNLCLSKKNGSPNLAKEYPIPQGIINSFLL